MSSSKKHKNIYKTPYSSQRDKKIIIKRFYYHIFGILAHAGMVFHNLPLIIGDLYIGRIILRKKDRAWATFHKYYAKLGIMQFLESMNFLNYKKKLSGISYSKSL